MRTRFIQAERSVSVALPGYPWLVLLLVVYAFSSCMNPTGSSNDNGDNATLADDGGSIYQPVENVPQPGSGGAINISQSGSKYTVTFDAATDVETAQGDLEYSLFLNGSPIVSSSEDLWYIDQQSIDQGSSRPWYGFTAFQFSDLRGPIYINVGVRDSDGNVSAYEVEYLAPAASSATYVIRDLLTADGSVSFNIGTGSSDVIYILTNSGIDPLEDTVAVDQDSFNVQSSMSQYPSFSVQGLSLDLGDSPRGVGIRGFPGQHEIRAPLIHGISESISSSSISNSSVAASSEIGSSDTFETDSGTVNATAVARGATGDWDVTIWLDSDHSSGVTQTMVDQLVARFMRSADDNDIFDWVTGVFGNPWGSHSYSNLIQTNRRDIHILLYDIAGDGVPADGESRTVGYFWGQDNYDSNTFKDSNERLMFYMDAPLLSTKDGAGWQISDYWPAEVVSTLAHEFQHMVQFYRRTILKGPEQELDTWWNEMASLSVEDIVSRDVAVPGPRGVNPTVGSAGGSGNWFGRVPGWIGNSTIQIDSWDKNDPLPNYATAYSFGATMMRMHGVGFLSDLMTVDISVDEGRSAIVNAINAATGGSYSFEALLSDWALAMLLSNDTSANTSYRINTGGWQATATNENQYSLGSINVHNYSGGFPIRTPSATFSYEIPPASSIFVRVATDHSGTFSDNVTLPANTWLRVVERQN